MTETSLAVNPEPMTLSFKVRRERRQEGERERERRRQKEQLGGSRHGGGEKNETRKRNRSLPFLSGRGRTLVHRPRSEAAPGSFRTLPSRPTTILSRDSNVFATNTKTGPQLLCPCRRRRLEHDPAERHGRVPRREADSLHGSVGRRKVDAAQDPRVQHCRRGQGGGPHGQR